MEVQTKKIGFFKRVWIAIFKLEDYGTFLDESFKKAVKYLLCLVLFVSLVAALFNGYQSYKGTQRLINYIKEDLPDFSFKEGILTFTENAYAYDEEFGTRLFIETDKNLSDARLQDYRDKSLTTDTTVALFRDGFYVRIDENELTDKYINGLSTIEDTKELMNTEQTKENLVEGLGDYSIAQLYGSAVISNFVAIFAQLFLTTIGNWIMVLAFGYIVSTFAGVRFKFSPLAGLAVYSITLSTALIGIYSVVYTYTRFVISHFDLMYTLIAYIYIVAAIFMIKYDLIKQSEELQKIIEVQKQVRKELEEEEEQKRKEEKEKEEENKTDDEKEKTDEESNEPEIDGNNEPDGSEI